MTTKELIDLLELKPHPEGGFYKETYRCLERINTVAGKDRNVSTSIYYLLENTDKSHFHRIASDELWFFHQGKPLEIIIIQDGVLQKFILGNDLTKGELPQAVIPAKAWFASHILEEAGHSLVSCVVAPGFDFEDFEMANRDELIQAYPHLSSSIIQFTK